MSTKRVSAWMEFPSDWDDEDVIQSFYETIGDTEEIAHVKIEIIV